MNHQDQDAETQLAQCSVPRSLSPTLNMSPFIRSFQDNVTSWMSNLINQQDGPLQMVAQQTTQGRLRQEQLAQTVAHNATMPSQNDQAQYLRAQLAHRDAQLEHVRSECAIHTHFVQEEEELLALCVYSAVKLKAGNPEW